MADQSFQNHTHRPTHTGVVWLLALIALILAIVELGWISRMQMTQTHSCRE